MEKFQEIWNAFSEENGIARYISMSNKWKRIQKSPEAEDYYVPLCLTCENGITKTILFAEMFEEKVSNPVPVTPDVNLLPELPQMLDGVL